MMAKQHAYAVVRLDLPKDRRFDQIARDPGNWITVKEVVPTPEEADSEVDRLNRVNADKACIYFAQITRLFPDGRGVQDP